MTVSAAILSQLSVSLPVPLSVTSYRRLAGVAKVSPSQAILLPLSTGKQATNMAQPVIVPDNDIYGVESGSWKPVRYSL